MDDLLFFAVIGIYLFSALFFVFISKQCFIETKPVRKCIASFFLSPSFGYFVSFMLNTLLDEANMFGDDFTDYKWGVLGYAASAAVLQLLLQIMCMYLYLKIINAKNPSIAMFVYLCSIMIVPSIIYMVSFSDLGFMILALSYLILHIIFYILAIIPLKAFSKEEQATNTKLFILVPGITYLFNTLMFGMYMYSFYIGNLGDDFSLRFVSLRDVENNVVQNGLHVLHLMINLLKYQNYILIFPTIFVTAVVIFSFSLVVRNTKYMNETLKAKDDLKELSVEVMEALAHTIDAKDEYTKGHSIRVATYSRMIAEQMGLTPEQCESIYYMGLLHDLGKIGVPNEIINKPGSLTAEEYEKIKVHPGMGSEILSEIKSHPELMIGARWHHERYDGKGYPDQKQGNDIPLEARIIAVADCYDAMTSNRSYRHYLDQDKVKTELRRVTGTQLDEKPVEAMIKIMEADKEYKMHE